MGSRQFEPTTAIVSEPVATAISMARDLIPSVDALREMTGGDPFSVNAVVPAILIHIFAQEIENAHAEIGRLEKMLLLAGEPGGSA